MPKWRTEYDGGYDLDDMFELIIGEQDITLDQRVRGWAALAELYQEQYYRLLEFKATLTQVWRSDGANAYLEQLDALASALNHNSVHARGVASALDSVSFWIGATQQTLDELRIEFEETAMADAVDEYNEAMDDIRHRSWTDNAFGENTDTPDAPVRSELLESSGFNDRGREAMDLAAAEISDLISRTDWLPDTYSGPTNSRMPSYGGFPPPPVPSAPAPPPAAPVAPAPPVAAPPAPPVAPVA
ncbi:MAG: hypothetical protein ACRDT6_28510, partial [Micromonosporaceae bacterium]